MQISQLQKNLKNVKELTPEIFKETMRISVPFFMIHKKLFESGDIILKEQFKLNQSELDILATLYYMSEGTFTLSPTQLYESLMFSSGGMTKVLKNLQNKEYITRVDNPKDQRSKLVQLTSLGEQITQDAIRNVVEHEDLYFSKLDPSEQELFRNLLLKILAKD